VGQLDLIQGLLQSVPSFNYSSMMEYGDTAGLLSYARLRGLSPNNTLVLVDGHASVDTAGSDSASSAPESDGALLSDDRRSQLSSHRRGTLGKGQMESQPQGIDLWPVVRGDRGR